MEKQNKSIAVAAVLNVIEDAVVADLPVVTRRPSKQPKSTSANKRKRKVRGKMAKASRRKNRRRK